MSAARRIVAAWWIDIVALAAAAIFFVIPFVFIVLIAAKSATEATTLDFTLPTRWELLPNLEQVMAFASGRAQLALLNSMILTVGSVTLIVLLSALVGFTLQRRVDRLGSVVGSVMLAGLIIPPTVFPTIFLLQHIGLYKTLLGMILVETAFTMPFAVLVFRAFMASIPREMDEAAIIDGASPLRIFFQVILPLMRPAIITVIVVAAVAVYNDFTGPLYFLPGNQNVTAQVTLYNFISQYNTQWNLLFADVIIVTIPPLIMFILFQRQLVSGLSTGAIR